MVSSVEYQARLDGSIDVDRVIFAPGEILALFLWGPGRQVALLSAKALHFNPRTQAPEKELTRYLATLWRIRASTGTYGDPIRVGTLLERARLELREKPILTLRRLEKVLNTLQAEGVTGRWRYSEHTPGASWEDTDRPARGWVEEWLQASITIEPPPAIRSHYAPIGARGARPAAIAPQAAALGDRLSETRKRLNLTQAAAAEACDVPQQTYSRAERTGSASRENRRKLETWLAANQVEIQAWLSIRR
jgi:DNA-binding XRE family transcriptional regulator